MEESRAHSHAGAVPAQSASPDGTWLAATRPFVRSQLPPPPARVIELGCGQFGGHVPALIRAGWDATGVDPQAPEGAAYRRAAFEDYRPDGPADAVIASVSLHHVEDPGAALGHAAEILGPDGTLVVVEWISEDFDEATARWCFRIGSANQTNRTSRAAGWPSWTPSGPSPGCPGTRSSGAGSRSMACIRPGSSAGSLTPGSPART